MGLQIFLRNSYLPKHYFFTKLIILFNICSRDEDKLYDSSNIGHELRGQETLDAGMQVSLTIQGPGKTY